MSEKEEQPITILLIENEEHDVFLFRRALSQIEFTGSVKVVGGVTQAKQYLLGERPYDDRRYNPLPNVIVSDLKMEGATGIDFLSWIKQHPTFKDLPVCILSGSGLPQDRDRALQLGAWNYFTKSGDFIRCVENARKIAEQGKSEQ